jgi:gluconate 2-dehydrogenase gamma chain
MTEINRRTMLHWLGAAPAAAVAFTWTQDEVAAAAQHAHAAQQETAATKAPYKPRFFNANEYATITLLSDLIIPKDERSGSASDAGAPEFIDYIVSVQPDRQTAMRGGLLWLDNECRRRFDRRFLAATAAQRGQILDDIAFPAKAPADLSHGVRFFSTLRDLVATGFWSSKIGMADIGYMGNVYNPDWKGAPENVLRKLGVSYE